MNKRILTNSALATFASLFVINAYAVAPGFYMGIMGGPSTNNGGTIPIQTAVPPPAVVAGNPKSTQFGSRIYIGYKINEYAGIEHGLAYYSGIDYNTKGVETCSSAKARVRDIDLNAKGTYSFNNLFDVFGKAGVALAYQTTSGSLNPNLGPGAVCGKSKYVTQFKPTISVGASYTMTQNIVIDGTWNRLMMGGTLGSIDMYALGFSYHFVDVYCGQFLCS